MGKLERSCWCGSREAEPVWSARSLDGKAFGYVRCAGCGVVALFPQPNDETLAEAYRPAYYGNSSKKFLGPVSRVIEWFQGSRARLVDRGLRASNGRAHKVLDVGCGNGGFIHGCKMRGHDAEGIELSEYSARRAQEQAGCKVHVGELPDLDLPAASYSALTMWHVLEHVRAPERYIAEAARLLNTQGRLYLSLPNGGSWQAQAGPHWFHLDPPRHLYSFNMNSLSGLLRSNGFAVESVSHLSLEQNPFGFIQSWLNMMGFDRDMLFEMLKGCRRVSGARELAAALLGILLAAPAVAASLAEAAAGRGGTVTLIARKS
ncbi:class I SAM-dependent methyltransferase [bacterium]|nr:class I SAM-dependent methyltransferase [bacterium]